MAKTKIVLLYEKIKLVFKVKGMSGKHLTGFVPYGYLWDEKRENWIVDSEAADVVRHIYAMTLEGYDPFQIASRLTAAQKRAGELERLVCKIYEDNALDRLPDARYAALDAQYAKEQETLAAEIVELEKAVSSYDQGKKSAEKFIALIDKYQGFETMTNTMLNEFVDKILVHERDRKGCRDTTQTVEIHFNFVGRYIPPSFRDVELTPEEQEAFRRREERRDKLHQAYLRRKASGKQQEYDRRYNAKCKPVMDAKRVALRTEDMERGIFTTVASLPHQEPQRTVVQVRPTF